MFVFFSVCSGDIRPGAVRGEAGREGVSQGAGGRGSASAQTHGQQRRDYRAGHS